MLKIWSILAVLVLVFPLVACEERKGCAEISHKNYTQMFCTHPIVFWGSGYDAVSAIHLNEWPVREHTQDRWRFLVRRWFRYYNAKGSNKKFIEIYELDRDKSCLNRPNEVDLSRGFLVYADMFPGSMIGEQKPCKSKVFLWDCVPEKLREKLLHFNQVPIHWEHLGHTCSIGNVKPPPKYHRQAVKLPS